MRVHGNDATVRRSKSKALHASAFSQWQSTQPSPNPAKTLVLLVHSGVHATCKGVHFIRSRISSCISCFRLLITKESSQFSWFRQLATKISRQKFSLQSTDFGGQFRVRGLPEVAHLAAQRRTVASNPLFDFTTPLVLRDFGFAAFASNHDSILSLRRITRPIRFQSTDLEKSLNRFFSFVDSFRKSVLDLPTAVEANRPRSAGTDCGHHRKRIPTQ